MENDEEAVRAFRIANNLPVVVDVFSMNYSIRNGKFVVSSDEQGKLNLPTMSSQWEQDHPSLYASINTVGLDFPDHTTDNTAMTVDQVFLDDIIVVGSACIGQDCNNGENFGFDTIRLKENNLRIRFVDTSNSASFPTNDWQITANDSSNGGANKFSIDDIDNARTPFTILAGAPSNSLYVSSAGRIGLRTSTPVVELHMKDGDSPTFRLEQDGSSGFQSQTWDIAGNEANFFVRDVTNGSKLPFKILPNAATNTLVVAGNGNVGIGKQNPATKLDVVANASNGITVSSHNRDGLNVVNNTASAGNQGAGIKIGQDDGAPLANGDKLGLLLFGGSRGANDYRSVAGIQSNATENWSQSATGADMIFQVTRNGTTGRVDVMKLASNGKVGIGVDYSGNPTNDLDVCGTIGATSATVNTITCSSDARFKKNISPLQRSLEKVLSLQGVNYDWRVEEFPKKQFAADRQMGFIAQEIEDVFPSVVLTDEEGFLSVDYSRLTPVLVEAIKEQQAIIDAQQAEINSLQSQLASLEELKSQVAALTQMVMKQQESDVKNTQAGDE